MDTYADRIRQVEQNLCRLLEGRGFRRTGVAKFEDYDLYVDNKNFLQTDQIITFMDMNGRLLALKPDVTLSIVKNIPAHTLSAFEKLYYVDEVYRLSKDVNEYRVLRQIGVELIGPLDDFSGVEIVDLALGSLALIDDSFVLDVSHLAFVSGLIDRAALSSKAKKNLLSALHAKSRHEVEALLAAAGVSQEERRPILELCGLCGSFSSVLGRAKKLVRGRVMEQAYGELCRLGGVLEATGMAGRVNLDFSVVNDLDYYSGLIFTGYVEGIPGPVLSGGRYDNLMKKMQKSSGAMGFGIFLSELEGFYKSKRAFDFDLLVTYDEGCDYAALLSLMRDLTEAGKAVRIERGDCALSSLGWTYEKRLHIPGEAGETKGESSREVEKC